MVEQLMKILAIIDEQLNSENNVWDKEILTDSIVPELKELLEHFSRGEKFFKYGKKQRRLISTFFITDSLNGYLGKNLLGRELLKLQEIYDRV